MKNKLLIKHFAIEEGIKQKKLIDKFQNWLISIVNNLEAEDRTNETRNVNTMYKNSTEGLHHPNGLYFSNYFDSYVRFHTWHIQRDLYDSLLQTVQRYFCTLYYEKKKY